MDDRTVYTAPAANYLVITRGSGQGRMFLLVEGLTTIGRAADNTIVIDAADLKASRHHAVIRVEGGVASVEDLGSSNGTQLDGAPVDKAVLEPGLELCVGETVFVLSQSPGACPVQAADSPPATPAKPKRRAIVVGAILAVVLAALLVVLLRRGGEEPAPDRPKAAATVPAGPKDGADQPKTPPAASPQTEKSLEAMRMGQFFYNSRNLKKAVEQWSEAVTLAPDNAQAVKLLERTKGELDQLVDKHYRQALLALRYQRTEEARTELRQVVENSLNPADERVQDSLKKLDELGGR